MGEYTVYVHIDPEGKRYYGATKQRVKKRWKNGKGYPHNKYFTEAILKHGWDNFQHIIVAKGLSKDEAYCLEEELIEVWDTTNPDKGYNITKGGYGTNGWNPTDDTKNKMSEAKKGKYYGKNHPMYGKHHSEETRKKMSENHADFNGKNHPQAKSVICLTTKRIFCTVKEGAKYYGIKSSGTITECCNGKRKSAGKYNGQKLLWRYIEIVPID